MFSLWRSRFALSSSKIAKSPRHAPFFVEQLEDRLALSVLLPDASRDFVYDSVRNELDVITTNGHILQVNPQTMQIVNNLNIGASLYDADISSDGNSLYVTDSGDYGSTAYLHQFNLNTMGLTNVGYSRVTNENGSWDVALTGNGKGLFDGLATGSGPLPLHQITLSNNQITTLTNDPGAAGGGRLPASTFISRSADRSLFLFSEGTSGAIFTYNASTGTFSQSVNVGANLTNELTAVSRNGSLLAIEVGSGLLILNSQFQEVNFLQGLTGGVAFDPTKDAMYAVNPSTGEIVTYNTDTWAVQSQMAVGETTTAGQVFGNGMMTVSSNDQWLFLATPSGVREYSLIGNPNPATHLAITGGSGSPTAGAAVTLTISALDQYNNVATSYTGTVHFASSDPQAVLPANYTYTAADAGVHTFTFTFKTAGPQTLTVDDIQNPSQLYLDVQVPVTPGALATFSVSAPTPDPTGYPISTTFSARDAYNNIITNYTGSIHVTSSDSIATLPANYTFTASNEGVATLPVTINTAGNQTIKATDLSSGASGSTTVQVENYVPGLHFSVTSSAATVTTHSPFTITVTALDSNNNVGVHYSGTIHFTSSDPNAVLPADYTFTAADHGVHTFTITLDTVTSSAWVTFQDTSYITYLNGGTVTENVVPAPVTTFGVHWSAAAVAAGSADSITLTAADPYGNLATNYRGTVQFTSSDPQAVLPANYTFTAADAGVHTFVVTLKTAGSEFVNIANGIYTTTAPVTVNPAAMVGFAVELPPGEQTPGSSVTPTVYATDAYNNVVTNYTGTVQFTSSDPAATLPPDYTFTTSDQGAHTFALTFQTPGMQTFTAADVANPALTGTETVEVGNYVPGLNFFVTPSTWNITAGQPFSLTVEAMNNQGQVVTNFNGTVSFSSTDTAAGVVLPPSYTFTAGDAGVHTFSSITLITASTADNWTMLTVSDPYDGAAGPIYTSIGLPVYPAAASSFRVTGFPATTTAGSSESFTVTALDKFGNVSDQYQGTVQFTSSDPQAVLPADYTFTYNPDGGPADDGVHTFTAALGTEGVQSISVNAVAAPSMSGSETGITVTPAAASSFKVSGSPSPILSGTSDTFSVTALDAYGNVATGYTGTVQFSSSDPQAVLPADYMFSAADQGVHTFTATVETAGAQQLTATDTTSSAITGSQTVQVLNPVTAGGFIVTGLPTTATAGTTETFTVTVLDANGNVDTGYTGTVEFSSTDPQAILPADYLFTAADQGVHTFTASLLTAGVQTLTVSDALAPSVAASADITVTPAAAVSLRVDGFPTGLTAGTPATLTVTALDAFGNVATGYTGTVQFTSNVTDIGLPANYTFTAADAGVHVFQVTLYEAYQQNITVTDVNTPSITGTDTGLLVSPAAAYQIYIGSPTDVQAGVPFTVWVNVYDMYGNIVDYTGTLHVASSDPAATLPANFTMTASDNGSDSFQMTFATPGTQTLTVNDLAGDLLSFPVQISVS